MTIFPNTTAYTTPSEAVSRYHPCRRYENPHMNSTSLSNPSQQRHTKITERQPIMKR
ncbi:hypothetical protein P692DRAFT_20832421 [Suillus brevipes Sb2]|nr:hypothetical protein P692DRAFT_20832421 [Suillus brevipes Sb2]